MSKILKVQDGDYKVSVREDGNITLYTGKRDAAGYGSGNTLVSGDLTVDGGNIYSTNTEFHLLNCDTSSSDTNDGPLTVRAFLNATTLSINDNLTQPDLTHQISIGNSLSSTQIVNLVNATSTVNQFLNVANSITPDQVISLGELVSGNLKQHVLVANSNTEVQLIKVGNSTATTSQVVEVGSSITPSQTIKVGDMVRVDQQTVRIANAKLATVSQDITIGTSETPSQLIEIGANSVVSNTQTINVGTNVQAAVHQSTNIANVVAADQLIQLGISDTTSQNIVIGDVLVNDTQLVSIANSVSNSRQDIKIGNSTTPTQVVKIAETTAAVRQKIQIGIADTPEQHLEISNLTSGTNTLQKIFIGNTTSVRQWMKLFNSNVSEQIIDLGTSTATSFQKLFLGNLQAGSNSQIIKLGESQVNTTQQISIGTGTSQTQTISIGDAQASTNQLVNIANAVTPSQVIKLGSLTAGNSTQDISIACSVSSNSQVVAIANSNTPSQQLSIGNSTSSTSQLVNIANSTTPTQEVTIANTVASSKQLVDFAISETPLQELTIGDLIVNDSQIVKLANSESTVTQEVYIANSYAPVQKVDFANSTNSTSQVINIGNTATPLQVINLGATQSLQTINIGSESTLSSIYNVGTGPTAAGQTKTVNIGRNSVAGSTTNVNIAPSTEGTTTIGSANVVGELLTQNLWNTVATTVNAFGDATEINIGKSTGPNTGLTTIRHDLVVQGDLTVNGITTTVNSTVMTVDDKNIELASTLTPSDITAEGGGVTLKGTVDKTFNWYSTSQAWTSSENLDLILSKVYKIDNIEVLSSTGVLNNELSVTAFTSATDVTIASAVGVTNIRNNLDVDLDIEVGGNIYPTTNIASDIGSATNRFRDLYLSGNTIYLGNTQISSDVNDVLNVDHGIKITGNADFNATGYIKVPVGTELERPGLVGQPPSAVGQIRFNTTGVYFEGYDGIKWKRLGVDIDSRTQYGSLAPFVMDKYEINLFKTCEYTIQMVNPLSTHTVKVIVNHNWINSNFTLTNEVIIGAPVATITTRINNGFVEVLLTPVYEATEVEYSRLLLDNKDPVIPSVLSALPANGLDEIDLNVTSFDIDLTTLDGSNFDLNTSRVPGYAGILPLTQVQTHTTHVLDLATTSYTIDFNQSLNTNLLNNNGLVDEVLAGIPVGEADKIDLSAYYYYVHPALAPIVMEAPSTP